MIPWGRLSAETRYGHTGVIVPVHQLDELKKCTNVPPQAVRLAILLLYLIALGLKISNHEANSSLLL